MAKTEEEIKEMLEGKLYIGKTVKVERWTKQYDALWHFKGARKGVVEGLYPHIFTVRIGRYLESYRYSQCIEQNETRVKL